ncbi:MAG: DUF2937 family protein [Parachlamydiaceae bacterium]|nr:MAG: DUF2937 family protein [Parachlamydiaceae bacterium]
MFLFSWIGGLIDRIFAVAGALILSQFPLFMQQYQQQLTGHISELQLQINSMRNAALLTGKSLKQYILKFLQSEDLDFKHQGEILNNMLQRYDHLLQGQQALQEAPFYAKPILFVRYLDLDIARSTWAKFEVGFPLNPEGFFYAILGILLGLAIYWALRKICQRFFKTSLKTAP